MKQFFIKITFMKNIIQHFFKSEKLKFLNIRSADVSRVLAKFPTAESGIIYRCLSDLMVEPLLYIARFHPGLLYRVFPHEHLSGIMRKRVLFVCPE